ncbi:MAG: low molecular weight phosphatase family protein [Bryobacteraceae bacterium]
MRRVLFLCIGNSCRSQMAEGFARTYGSDVMEAASAGLSPAGIVQPLTKQVMRAKNINIDDQYPKDLSAIDASGFDLIINMSGAKLPARIPIEVRDWAIEDPIGQSEQVYLAVGEQIEHLVMNLILELRRESRQGDRSPKRQVRGGLRGGGKIAPKPSSKRKRGPEGLVPPETA